MSLSGSTVDRGGDDRGRSTGSKSVGESDILGLGQGIICAWNGTGQTCAQRDRRGSDGLGRSLRKGSRDHKDRGDPDIGAVVAVTSVGVERVSRLTNSGQRSHKGNGDLARQVHVGVQEAINASGINIFFFFFL